MENSTHTALEPALYVVATPIGNMQDISLRALDVLRRVGLVAAEDTRHSAHLLAHHGISNKLMAVHEHNEQQSAQLILQKIQQGIAVALISDAGTPAISDPGAVVVDVLLKHAVRVIPVPGASAVTAAMSATGMPNHGYLFHGFLPASASQRKATLQALAEQAYTVVYYEAPHRILACIKDMREVLGEQRQIAVARELTKQFETIYRGSLAEVFAWMQADENQQRGEFVLLLAPKQTSNADADLKQAQHVLSILLAELPLKQAVKLATEITAMKKNQIYELALKMKQDE